MTIAVSPRPPHVQLKTLQTQFGEANAEIASLKQQKSEFDRKIFEAQRRASNIQQQLDSLTATNKKLIISEHATLRYIERVMGYPVEDLMAQIVPEKVEAVIKMMGNGQYPHVSPAGVKYTIVVKGGTVVSIITSEGQL